MLSLWHEDCFSAILCGTGDSAPPARARAAPPLRNNTMKLRSLLLLSGLLLAFALTLVPAPAQDAAAPAADAAVTNAADAAQSAPAAGADAAPAAPNGPRTFLQKWATYFKQGGVTMVFIGLLSVLGVACALERFVNMRRSRIVPDGFSARVIELWRAGRFQDIEALCSSNGSVLARVVETMLEHKESRDYQEVKLFAEDKCGRELRLESRRASMLATVSTLAPLLGLFGTVLGLLEAFGTVALMGEMGDVSVLADSIGKALVTTVAGLAVSMPALFVHNLFRNRLNLYAVLLEEEVADVVNYAVIGRR